MEKDNIKYLGVIIDSLLNWKKHISTVSFGLRYSSWGSL